jgi:3-deoxy-D-arabino-heptulosonate 7-phosphate (DAHP) synthase
MHALLLQAFLAAVEERVEHRHGVCANIEDKVKRGFAMLSHLQKGTQALKAKQVQVRLRGTLQDSCSDWHPSPAFAGVVHHIHVARIRDW